MVKCKICFLDYSVLSLIDFKDMIWRQSSKFEEIKNNDLIKKTELELCYSCRQRLFSNSKITITFSPELLEAMKQKETLEVKPIQKREAQIKI